MIIGYLDRVGFRNITDARRGSIFRCKVYRTPNKLPFQGSLLRFPLINPQKVGFLEAKVFLNR